MLAKVDAESAQAVRAAITEELLELVKAEAVTQARAELEQECSDRREQLLDEAARFKAQAERDADSRIDVEVAAAIKEQEADWMDRLDDLRGRVRDARERAQTAEALVVSLLTQLCGRVDQKPVYLASGGQGVQELDKAAVNRVLARAGVVLKSKATASERRVRITLEDGRPAEHVLFWLTKTTPPGVIDADADDAKDTAAPDKSA